MGRSRGTQECCCSGRWKGTQNATDLNHTDTKRLHPTSTHQTRHGPIHRGVGKAFFSPFLSCFHSAHHISPRQVYKHCGPHIHAAPELGMARGKTKHATQKSQIDVSAMSRCKKGGDGVPEHSFKRCCSQLCHSSVCTSCRIVTEVPSKSEYSRIGSSIPIPQMMRLPRTTATMFITRPALRKSAIWMRLVPEHNCLWWCRHKQHEGKGAFAGRQYQQPHRVRQHGPHDGCV